MRPARIQLAMAAVCVSMLAWHCAAEEPAASPAPTPQEAAPATTPAESVVVPLAPAPDPVDEEKPLFSEADAVTLAAYRLDEGRLARFEALVSTLDTQLKTDETLRAEMDHDDAKSDGIDKFVESIEKDKPSLLALIKSAGMTPREFVLTSYSLTMAMVYADYLRVQPASPLPDFVVRENIIFVRRNEERLAKIFQSLNHD